MKFVEVRNDSGKQLSIPAIRGLTFLPDEVKKVTPATVKHPAVSQYIGRGLTLVTSSQGEEPKAPISVAAVPAAKPAVAAPAAAPAAPAAEPKPVPKPPTMESQKETAGNLQEAYLAAPGISEENVQALLSALPTFTDLATATVSAVQVASGLSKSACRRLQTWAASQSVTA
jgi:hypothetical protein